MKHNLNQTLHLVALYRSLGSKLSSHAESRVNYFNHTGGSKPKIFSSNNHLDLRALRKRFRGFDIATAGADVRQLTAVWQVLAEAINFCPQLAGMSRLFTPIGGRKSSPTGRNDRHLNCHFGLLQCSARAQPFLQQNPGEVRNLHETNACASGRILPYSLARQLNPSHLPRKTEPEVELGFGG